MSSNPAALQSFYDFIKKYFFVKQALHTDSSRRGSNVSAFKKNWSFVDRHRRIISILIPFVVVHCIWWAYMATYDKFYIFHEPIGKHKQPNYLLSITMIFGSMIAGSTSEGGAAVAFPVLTLLFGVLPSVARDFSYMIQSVGMTCAAFTILFMGVKLEYHSLFWCTIGGTAGVIFGLELISSRLSPAYTKMYFVWIWFSFAIALFWLNLYHDRKVYHAIPYWLQGKLKYSDLRLLQVYLADVGLRVLRCTPLLGRYVPVSRAEVGSKTPAAPAVEGCDGTDAERGLELQEHKQVQQPAGSRIAEVSRSRNRSSEDSHSHSHSTSSSSSATKVDGTGSVAVGAETEAAAVEAEAQYIQVMGMHVNWKALVLLVGGFLGGIFSAMGGSGLDICSFALLTLLFCVSERIATPTSVVLMAINTVVAFAWRGLYNNAIESVCWDMWLACIPVVVVGAPLGAVISSHWHRLVIALLVVAIDVAQLIGAMYVVRPWTTLKTNHPEALMTKSLVLFFVAGVLFTMLALGGNDLLQYNSTSDAIPAAVREQQESLYAEEVFDAACAEEETQSRSSAAAVDQSQPQLAGDATPASRPFSTPSPRASPSPSPRLKQNGREKGAGPSSLTTPVDLLDL